MIRFGYTLSLLASACLVTLVGCSFGTDSGSPSGSSKPAAMPRFDPSAERTPKASKSLTFASDWQPPPPTRSTPGHAKARIKPAKQYGVPTRTVGAHPVDSEIRAVMDFPEPLRPVAGASSPEETEALASALRERPHDDRGIDAIAQFTENYPRSRWSPVLHLNMGAISYRTGYFQDALSHWKAAWELAKTGEDVVSKDLANQALAEYAKMNARIGRLTELEALITEAESRNLMGDARVKIASAAEGLWAMRHRPGISFRCGPYALLNVSHELKPELAHKAASLVDRVQSPPTGFSIPEVQRMGSSIGLKLQIAKREPGAPVIVPAVVHWKVGHFGAIVRDVNGSYLLKDPTFGNETWLTQQAVDREASGYFLVPAGPLPKGWTRATAQETAHLYGKGYTEGIDDGPTGSGDPPAGGPCPLPGGGGGPGPGPGLPMATYFFHILVASLHIEDTPTGYSAAVGPDVRVRLAYNQREAGQPTSIDFTSFGPQFVSNWVSYLVDNTTSPSANVTLYKRDGGHEVHTNFNTTTQSFGVEIKTAAVLYRLTPNTYKKVYPDGRQEFYEQYLGTTGTKRRVFLSRIVDPQGNEVALTYDSTYPARIHQIVDATGLPTVFQYAYAGEPYLVTSIEDPYGRTSTFTYAPIATKVRLQSTEDPYGIVSSFTYSGAGEIVAMTTPYGTTTFNLSPPYISTGLFRYVEATDPLGQKERIEYNVDSAVTGVPATLETPHPSSSVVNFATSWNNYRNSFYWDKLRMKLAPGDYLKAHRYHWLHLVADTATSILESEVPPLEGRIFYNYPGQVPPEVWPPVYVGTLAFPSVVARVVKDAQGNNQTQGTRYEYNAQGNVTKKTDPVGRETVTEYAANGVDVVAIKQRTGTSGGTPVYTTLSTFAYASGIPPHRPSSVTDGAGQTTTYTYTASGQVETITNAKSEVTTFTYETNTASAAFGRVLSITGAVPGGNRSFTYDGDGRVRTSTDSEGYTLTYDYDNLDRVRTITYPDSSFEQFEYEDHSLVASRDRAGRWTRHMYNQLMQRVVTQDPALRTTQFQWCRCGELRRFVDGNGNMTEWERDERSRVKKQIHANGTFDAYAYDYSGRLLSETDPTNRTVTYQYTIDDRVSKKDYSDAATPDVQYTYDAWFPRVATRQDGQGTTSFTYHPYGTSTLGAGSVALINGPLTDDTKEHTYDELGRLKKLEIVDDATQSVASYSEEYTFDTRARVTGVQNNLGASTYAFVGQSGRPSSATYANGMQVLYDYFGVTGDFLLKQIKNLSAPPTPTVISQFDYTYAQDRSIDTWTVDQGSGASTWTFGYDGARELTSAKRQNGSTVLESLYYGYDKAGNRIQVGTGTTAPKNYDVNNLNQLLSERDHGKTTFAGFVDEPATVKVNGQPAKVMSTDGGAPYRFEALVNLDAGANTVVVEAKDGQNNTATQSYSVTTSGTAKNFEYDENGNLRFEKLPNNSVIREYRWDQQNRLVRMLAGAHESVYEYDGESHRVRIKELESSVETKNETFVWCGARICQKRNSGGVVRSYFREGFEASSSDYFYTRDHIGSVREVVASDGTTISGRVSYDPWGKATETGSVLPDFGFTGHYFDRATGLGLPQYRGYDPSLGRWLSKDPLGLDGGLNLYGYVNNDPSNLLDPTGLSPIGCDWFPWLPWCGPPPGPPPAPPPTPPGCHWEVDVMVCAPPPPPGPTSPPPSPPPGPPVDCNKISSLCSEQCSHYLGENPRPGKKCPNPMGTNTQFKFTACYKSCMASWGCN
jgi:RHS repeat-associated protein